MVRAQPADGILTQLPPRGGPRRGMEEGPCERWALTGEPFEVPQAVGMNLVRQGQQTTCCKELIRGMLEARVGLQSPPKHDSDKGSGRVVPVIHVFCRVSSPCVDIV